MRVQGLRVGWIRCAKTTRGIGEIESNMENDMETEGPEPGTLSFIRGNHIIYYIFHYHTGFI